MERLPTGGAVCRREIPEFKRHPVSAMNGFAGHATSSWREQIPFDVLHFCRILMQDVQSLSLRRAPALPKELFPGV